MRDVRALSADAVILRDGEVLLMQKESGAREGLWVLPGGYVDPDETASEACAREAREEVGLDVSPVTLVGLYDDPGRDERGNVSAAYLCRVLGGEPKPLEEAAAVQFYDPFDLPETGFDHDAIVRDAVTLAPTEG
ncbi:NUDIX hydrolase [Haloarculaceae archaeon H-GB2-1]|nr:NUDIX hydrolase [Haloarculaceae archaeon H-GB1-1]MEA5407286.1 NUDIX hydrolase [Haloarculaceae archaeon H-GB2-1]